MPGVVAAHASRDAALASLLTIVRAVPSEVASLASVSAARMANAAPSAGIRGAATAVAVSVSSSGTNARTASRATTATTAATAQAADDEHAHRPGREPDHRRHVPAVGSRSARKGAQRSERGGVHLGDHDRAGGEPGERIAGSARRAGSRRST